MDEAKNSLRISMVMRGKDNSEDLDVMSFKIKIRAFWHIAPCSVVGVDRRFGGEYCFNNQVMNG
jgi:hypothetical protein